MRVEDKMKRKFEDVLLKWKNDGMLKPMMVVDVRQIGKTYTIDRFCRDNFNMLGTGLNPWTSSP